MGQLHSSDPGRLPGGGLPFERDRDARSLAQGCKFWILVSLTVFWAEHHYNYVTVKVSFRVAHEKIFCQFVLFTQFNVIKVFYNINS